jgi:hypothetical protein
VRAFVVVFEPEEVGNGDARGGCDIAVTKTLLAPRFPDKESNRWLALRQWLAAGIVRRE